jgi:hypothetical protein
VTRPETPDPLVHRRRRLASLLALPVVLTVAGLCAVEGARLIRPDWPLFSTPFVYSLADAIENDDIEGALRFIQAGQDPNGLIAVRHVVLTNGRSVLVSPLVWAVATQHQRSVLMLLGYGARMDHEANSKAVCLAEAVGNTDIARLLRRYPPQPAVEAACDEPKPGAAPLLALGQRTE